MSRATGIVEHSPDKGCGRCPLQHERGPSHAPRHVCVASELRTMEHLQVSIAIGEEAPWWCPLRAGDVTITKGER